MSRALNSGSVTWDMLNDGSFEAKGAEEDAATNADDDDEATENDDNNDEDDDEAGVLGDEKVDDDEQGQASSSNGIGEVQSASPSVISFEEAARLQTEWKESVVGKLSDAMNDVRDVVKGGRDRDTHLYRQLADINSKYEKIEKISEIIGNEQK